MGKFHIFIVAFLLTGAAIKIDGGIFSKLFGSSTKVPYAPVANVKGRLLTPEEGCGYSKVQNTRIVGGSSAKVGAWPWLVLLAFIAHRNPIKDEIKFGCGPI